MRYIISFFLLIFSTVLHSQILQWAHDFGCSANYASGLAIATDHSGNSYVTGSFSGTVDFDPGIGVTNLISTGGKDIFISKFDPNGNLIWAISIGGSSDEQGNSIAVDASQNVVITGKLASTNVDFDPGPSTYLISQSGITDAFVAKYDTGGNFILAFKIGGTNIDIGNAIETDTSSNIIIAGVFYSSNTDFDPGTSTFPLSSAGSGDIFIAKYDSSGNFIFAFKIGGANDEEARAITIDKSQDILITGNFQSINMDFNPSASSFLLSSSGSDDAYVAKYSQSGNFIWAFKVGAVTNELGQSICTDSSQNVIFTGVFGGTNDFDPGASSFFLTSNGSGDGFVAKYDSSGNFIFAFGIGGTLLDEGWDLAINSTQDILLTGFISGTNIDLDPGPSTYMVASNGNYDFFGSKYDASGNFISGFSIGGASDDFANSIAVNPNDEVFITGYFNNANVDFDPGSLQYMQSVIGYSDIFLAKYTDLVTSEENNPAFGVTNAAIIFPNPANGKLTLKLNTILNGEMIEIYDSFGKIIQTKNIVSEKTMIDLSNEATGIYFYKIVSGEEIVSSGKFISE